MADEPTRGPCDTGRPLCGKPARPYAAGWRCDEHRPRSLHRAPGTDRPAPTTS